MNKQILTSLQDISLTNILIYIESKKDLQSYDFLDLSKEILKDIKKTIDTKVSSKRTYFSGKKFRELIVIYNVEKTIIDKVNFFGKVCREYTHDLCFISIHHSYEEELIKTFFLSRYSFQKYKSEKKSIKSHIYCTKDHVDSVKNCLELTENVFLARDLGETPANDLTPKIFAEKIKKTKFHTAKVKIIDYSQIKKQGLGLIEAVGKGSSHHPKMCIIEYIVDKKAPITAIVGKGVTFDTGGNQVKPGDFMFDMKGDMGGAAVTYALAVELDRQKVDKNFVFCIPLAENMLSGEAYKPSDIFTSYSGKTVEIVHTDAEGRLVLADGISYVSKNYKPSNIITIATLTGAVMVALGYRYAGVMGTNKKLIKHLINYSEDNTEQYVELPLGKHFIEKTVGETADLKNLDRGVHAGSSMGAAFLSQFLLHDEDYMHIDIAGAFINGADPYGKMPKGMTGFGVESLSKVLAEV